MVTEPRTGIVGGWPALSYGTAWITSAPGGTWTCSSCRASISTTTARGKTDEERDEDAARLHAFAKEHDHR